MATSAPAMAVSPSTCCATQTLDAEYSGNKPAWTFHLNVTNNCTNSIRISQIEFYTMGRLFFTDSDTKAITAGSTVTSSFGKIDMSGLFPSQDVARCHYSPGGTASEVQRITITDTAPPGGTFQLRFQHGTTQTTGNIAYPATPLQVQTALEGLSNIGAGNVSVAQGPNPNQYDVTFQGTLANSNVNELDVVNVSGVTGSVDTINAGDPVCDSPLCLDPIRTPWTGYSPCEVLLSDVTYALVTYQQLVGGQWVACGTPTRVDFLRASKCGGTAGCSGTYVVP
jgi:hypothetical protein